MCTLSLVRFDSAEGQTVDLGRCKRFSGPSWRVMFNRDEQRTRPVARPPVPRSHGSVRAVYPLDPPSDGTWIATTSARMVFALLNEYQRAGRRDVPLESRGRIILELLDAETTAEVVRRVCKCDVSRFPPFRLVVIDDDTACEFISDGHGLRLGAATRSDRWMRTSSSVDPEAVRAMRTRAFDRCVTQRSRAAQECFHAQVCANRPEAGVRMTRADARTVSVTTIDVFTDRTEIAYRPLVSHTEVLAGPTRRIGS